MCKQEMRENKCTRKERTRKRGRKSVGRKERKTAAQVCGGTGIKDKRRTEMQRAKDGGAENRRGWQYVREMKRGFGLLRPAVKQDGGQQGTLCQATEGAEQHERKQNEASGCTSH